MTTTQPSVLSEQGHSLAPSRKHRRKARLLTIKRGIRHGAVPLGYRRMQQAGTLPIQKDTKTALLVKQAFRMLGHQDETIQTALSKMTNLGLRSRSGYPLSWAGLRYVLQNPFYVGLIRYQGKLYSGSHQPLISHSLFARVQRKLSERHGRRLP